MKIPGVEGLDPHPENMWEEVRVCFDPPPPPKNVTFFHSKLLLDNSAIFTSKRMKNLCQKWKVKLSFRGAAAPESVRWLDLTDPEPLHIYDRSMPLSL